MLAAAEGDARARLNNIEAMEQKAQNFDAYLFEGIDGNVSMETFVERWSEKIQSRLQEIDALHLKLIHGPDSTSAQIAAADKQIRTIHDQLDSMLKGVKAECSELGGFHDRIFGTKASLDDDRREGGLKAELDDRIAQLTKFEAEHRTRHQAMFDKIDSLLPGAASAGLATAYKSMRDSFQKPISRYTQAFYAALGLCSLVACSSFPIPSASFRWKSSLFKLVTGRTCYAPCSRAFLSSYRWFGWQSSRPRVGVSTSDCNRNTHTKRHWHRHTRATRSSCKTCKSTRSNCNRC